MFVFPSLVNLLAFPYPEGTNLEFKIGFTSSNPDKITQTICAILNSGGGYIVIGVRDTTREIVGIKTDKDMDNFLLTLDSIYHCSIIRKKDGTVVGINSIKTGVVKAANDREVLVITLIPEMDEKYSLKNGDVWYRLSASNFKVLNLEKMYNKKELEDIVAKRLATQKYVLRQQYEVERNAYMQNAGSEQKKLRFKIDDIKRDFELVVGASKKAEGELNEYRELLYKNILVQKMNVEGEMRNKNYYGGGGFFSFLCGCGGL